MFDAERKRKEILKTPGKNENMYLKRKENGKKRGDFNDDR